MANPEHLAILEQGVEVWNRWREENPEVEPDLSETDLSQADLYKAELWKTNLLRSDLREANLYEVNLYEADLSWVNLSNAELNGGNLSTANFSNADLRDAELQRVDFYETILKGAKLGGSELYEANFKGADLTNTDLMEARCGFTVFADIDFSETTGLDKIINDAPSTIGIDTIYKSKGRIPEAFLRGCGVPDQMIEYARSLTANPIEYYSCFISYSHKDEEFAKRLWEGLQAKNVRCWYAPHDMKIGDKIRPTIDDSIRIHDKLLLILSEYSVESDWVEHEVERALDLEKEKKQNILFPVRVDEAVMESKTGWAGNVRRQRHIGDFTSWKDHDAYSEAFERLLRDLKAG